MVLRSTDDPTIPAQYPTASGSSLPSTPSTSGHSDAQHLPIPSPSAQQSGSVPSPRPRAIQIIETARPSKDSEPSSPVRAFTRQDNVADGHVSPSNLSRSSSINFAGKLMGKLHLRHSSATGAVGGGSSPSGEQVSHPHSGQNSLSRPHSIREGEKSPRRSDKEGGSKSRLSSGRHTPLNATGDFGQFIAAAELQAALQEEQRRASQRDAELAKKEESGKHHGAGGFSLGNRKKRLSLSSRPTPKSSAETQPTEIAEGEDALPAPSSVPHFPGDLFFVSGASNYSPSKRSNDSNDGVSSKGNSTVKRPWLAPRASSSPKRDTIATHKHKSHLMPPALCGDVSDSESEPDESEILPLPEDNTPESRSSSETPAPSADQRPASLSSVSTSASTILDRTLINSQITARQDSAEPFVSAYWNSSKRHDDPSVRSLKSWNPSDEDARSVQSKGTSVSGGASAAISQPLLELEELELESFLRNFDRHTREVRVPTSQDSSRQRMPRWDDFRIPADEEEKAAAAGRRVTVLTHVDRGLQRLLAEGSGGALPRDATLPQSHDGHYGGKKKTKDDDKGKKAKRKDEQFGHRSPTLPSSLPLPFDEGSHASGSGERPGTTFAHDLRSPSESGTPSVTVPIASKTTHHHKDTEDGKGHSAGLPAFLGLRKRSGGNINDRSERKSNSENKKGTHKRSASGSATSDSELSRQARASTSTESAIGSPTLSSRPIDDNGDLPLLDEMTADNDQRSDTGWQLVDSAEAALPGGVDAKEVQVDSAKDEKVDGVAFCIAYILALVERYAPEHLDGNPNQAYRESKARSHLERVYLIAPFWENLLGGLRSLYRWEDPRRSGLYAMGYFCLWYADLIPAACGLYIIFNICRYRFFPPDASVLHAAVRRRMARGIEADKLAERLRRRSRLDVYHIYTRAVKKYGVASQVALGDVADFHEMSKNLILWRNPTATWRTIIIIGSITAFITFASAHVIAKTIFFGVGFMFFALLPLQSHYPRYRRPLNPLWWVLWGCPTDAQFAVALLRRRHLEAQQNEANDGKDRHSHGGSKAHHPSVAAHAVSHGGLDGTTLLYPTAGADAMTSVVDTANETYKTRKVGSYFCQHHGVPGHLHVTMERLYFVGIYSAATAPRGKSHKVAKTPLSEIAGLVKTKSINLFFYQSAGLQVVRKDGSSLYFSNVAHRDAAFNLLLAVGSETQVWTKV